MIRLLLTACLSFLAFAPAVAAQEPQAPAELGAAAIQERIDQVKADESLAAELKTALLDAWGKALEAAKAGDAAAEGKARLEARRAAAPEQVAAARQQLAALDQRLPGPERKVTQAEIEQRLVDVQLPELEQALARAQQDQAANARAAADIEQEMARRSERRSTLPTLIGELQKRLEALPPLAAEAPDVDARLQSARRALRAAERRRVQAELDAARAELAAYDAEEELLRARRDLAARQVTWDKANVESWQVQVQLVRNVEAQRRSTEAQQQADQASMADPRIARLAAENASLAKTLEALSSELLPRAERDRSGTDSKHQRLEREFLEVKKRVEAVGATDEVGRLLRNRRAQLNEVSRSTLSRSRGLRAQLADALLQRFDYDERRLRLVGDPDQWPEEEFGSGADYAQLEGTLAARARQLRAARQATLEGLAEGYRTLWTTLVDVDTKESQIAALVDQYRDFVTEHVLGIRSSAPLWQLQVQATVGELAWLFDPQSWRRAAALLIGGLLQEVWPIALLLPLLVALLLQPFLRRRIVRCGELALRGSNVAYAPTALAALYTLLLTLSLPTLVLLLAWRLQAHPDCGEFGKAVAGGAFVSMPILALVLGLRAAARPKGLGEAHFHWQSATLKHLRRNLPLLLPAAFPLSFVLGALEVRRRTEQSGSLATLVVLALLGLLLVVGWRMLHPGRGMLAAGIKSAPAPLLRFRWIWFLLGVGPPLTLLVMTVLGFDYTAMQLARRLFYTVAFVAAGAVVHALIVRALVLERRRLQIRSAQERLQAARAAGDGAAPAEPPPEEAIDPQSVARQTQTLLRGAITLIVVVAAYQIWVDVLPALAILDRIELWNDATASPPSAVTLFDLLLSLIVLVVAGAAARNLPGLLDLLVLHRMSMQTGERHAVKTLARYGIVIVGVLIAFSTIGVGWSKVQWLLAAVSVGLGFGLQEIFANFVSGLILLFERPARVGDIVTVGDVTGRVSRIRIRATTIQDWDRKELIVPNREFVTTRFVNWTLADSVVRWTIPVGVAYGTDTKRALELLAQAAAEAPQVLKDPKPEAVFTGFGASTLDLQLRVFVDMSAIDINWMTELLQAIDRLFREQGIVIAFPQHDVNLKVNGPLLERLAPQDLTGSRSD